MIPQNDYIICTPKKSEEKTKSGILLVKEGIDQETLGWGTVHAACEGSKYKKGQEVLFNKYIPVEWKIGKESFYSFKEDEIVAIV